MAGRAERQERGGAGTPPIALESASSFETERILRTTSSGGSFLQRLLSRNESAASYFSVPTDLDDDGFDDKNEAQSRKQHHRWVPEEEAGVVSRYTFGWVTGILSLGMTKHLEQSDLWDTAEVDDVRRVRRRFSRVLAATKDFELQPSGKMSSALWRTHRKRFILAGLIKLFHGQY